MTVVLNSETEGVWQNAENVNLFFFGGGGGGFVVFFFFFWEMSLKKFKFN